MNLPFVVVYAGDGSNIFTDAVCRFEISSLSPVLIFYSTTSTFLLISGKESVLPKWEMSVHPTSLPAPGLTVFSVKYITPARDIS
jgi:hypothetical protein